MQNLNKIPKLTRMAKKLGMRLKNVEFVGDGANFVYEIERKFRKTSCSYYYSNAERGIDEEVERLERLLTIEV